MNKLIPFNIACTAWANKKAGAKASFWGEGWSFQGYLTDKVMGEEKLPAVGVPTGLTYTAPMAKPWVAVKPDALKSCTPSFSELMGLTFFAPLVSGVATVFTSSITFALS
jgi:hypothetical protein